LSVTLNVLKNVPSPPAAPKAPKQQHEASDVIDDQQKLHDLENILFQRPPGEFLHDPILTGQDRRPEHGLAGVIVHLSVRSHVPNFIDRIPPCSISSFQNGIDGKRTVIDQ
jgi:hypothetical protein